MLRHDYISVNVEFVTTVHAQGCGLGFGVAKPWGDSERYDFILDSGEQRWRVQVKSTYVARTHS